MSQAASQGGHRPPAVQFATTYDLSLVQALRLQYVYELARLRVLLHYSLCGKSVYTHEEARLLIALLINLGPHANTVVDPPLEELTTLGSVIFRIEDIIDRIDDAALLRVLNARIFNLCCLLCRAMYGRDTLPSTLPDVRPFPECRKRLQYLLPQNMNEAAAWSSDSDTSDDEPDDFEQDVIDTLEGRQNARGQASLLRLFQGPLVEKLKNRGTPNSLIQTAEQVLKASMPSQPEQSVRSSAAHEARWRRAAVINREEMYQIGWDLIRKQKAPKLDSIGKDLDDELPGEYAPLAYRPASDSVSALGEYSMFGVMEKTQEPSSLAPRRYGVSAKHIQMPSTPAPFLPEANAESTLKYDPMPSNHNEVFKDHGGFVPVQKVGYVASAPLWAFAPSLVDSHAMDNFLSRPEAYFSSLIPLDAPVQHTLEMHWRSHFITAPTWQRDKPVKVSIPHYMLEECAMASVETKADENAIDSLDANVAFKRKEQGLNNCLYALGSLCAPFTRFAAEARALELNAARLQAARREADVPKLPRNLEEFDQWLLCQGSYTSEAKDATQELQQVPGREFIQRLVPAGTIEQFADNDGECPYVMLYPPLTDTTSPAISITTAWLTFRTIHVPIVRVYCSHLLDVTSPALNSLTPCLFSTWQSQLADAGLAAAKGTVMPNALESNPVRYLSRRAGKCQPFSIGLTRGRQVSKDLPAPIVSDYKSSYPAVMHESEPLEVYVFLALLLEAIYVPTTAQLDTEDARKSSLCVDLEQTAPPAALVRATQYLQSLRDARKAVETSAPSTAESSSDPSNEALTSIRALRGHVSKFLCGDDLEDQRTLAPGGIATRRGGGTNTDIGSTLDRRLSELLGENATRIVAPQSYSMRSFPRNAHSNSKTLAEKVTNRSAGTVVMARTGPTPAAPIRELTAPLLESPVIVINSIFVDSSAETDVTLAPPKPDAKLGLEIGSAVPHITARLSAVLNGRSHAGAVFTLTQRALVQARLPVWLCNALMLTMRYVESNSSALWHVAALDRGRLLQSKRSDLELVSLAAWKITQQTDRMLQFTGLSDRIQVAWSTRVPETAGRLGSSFDAQGALSSQGQSKAAALAAYRAAMALLHDAAQQRVVYGSSVPPLRTEQVANYLTAFRSAYGITREEHGNCASALGLPEMAYFVPRLPALVVRSLTQQRSIWKALRGLVDDLTPDIRVHNRIEGTRIWFIPPLLHVHRQQATAFALAASFWARSHDARELIEMSKDMSMLIDVYEAELAHGAACLEYSETMHGLVHRYAAAPLHIRFASVPNLSLEQDQPKNIEVGTLYPTTNPRKLKFLHDLLRILNLIAVSAGQPQVLERSTVLSSIIVAAILEEEVKAKRLASVSTHCSTAVFHDYRNTDTENRTEDIRKALFSDRDKVQAARATLKAAIQKSDKKLQPPSYPPELKQRTPMEMVAVATSSASGTGLFHWLGTLGENEQCGSVELPRILEHVDIRAYPEPLSDSAIEADQDRTSSRSWPSLLRIVRPPSLDGSAYERSVPPYELRFLTPEERESEQSRLYVASAVVPEPNASAAEDPHEVGASDAQRRDVTLPTDTFLADPRQPPADFNPHIAIHIPNIAFAPSHLLLRAEPIVRNFKRRVPISADSCVKEQVRKPRRRLHFVLEGLPVPDPHAPLLETNAVIKSLSHLDAAADDRRPSPPVRDPPSWSQPSHVRRSDWVPISLHTIDAESKDQSTTSLWKLPNYVAPLPHYLHETLTKSLLGLLAPAHDAAGRPLPTEFPLPPCNDPFVQPGSVWQAVDPPRTTAVPKEIKHRVGDVSDISIPLVRANLYSAFRLRLIEPNVDETMETDWKTESKSDLTPVRRVYPSMYPDGSPIPPDLIELCHRDPYTESSEAEESKGPCGMKCVDDTTCEPLASRRLGRMLTDIFEHEVEDDLRDQCLEMDRLMDAGIPTELSSSLPPSIVRRELANKPQDLIIQPLLADAAEVPERDSESPYQSKQLLEAYGLGGPGESTAVEFEEFEVTEVVGLAISGMDFYGHGAFICDLYQHGFEPSISALSPQQFSKRKNLLVATAAALHTRNLAADIKAARTGTLAAFDWLSPPPAHLLPSGSNASAKNAKQLMGILHLIRTITSMDSMNIMNLELMRDQRPLQFAISTLIEMARSEKLSMETLSSILLRFGDQHAGRNSNILELIREKLKRRQGQSEVQHRLTVPSDAGVIARITSQDAMKLVLVSPFAARYRLLQQGCKVVAGKLIPVTELARVLYSYELQLLGAVMFASAKLNLTANKQPICPRCHFQLAPIGLELLAVQDFDLQEYEDFLARAALDFGPDGAHEYLAIRRPPATAREQVDSRFYRWYNHLDSVIECVHPTLNFCRLATGRISEPNRQGLRAPTMRVVERPGVFYWEPLDSAQILTYASYSPGKDGPHICIFDRY